MEVAATINAQPINIDDIQNKLPELIIIYDDEEKNKEEYNSIIVEVKKACK